MSQKSKEMFTLAIGIGLLPPFWAVLAPHIGIRTGAVALICAGLYVTNGNKAKDGAKISLGFLMGDLWAVLALLLMQLSPLPQELELFLTLFVMGGFAVILGTLFARFIFLPSWLCGWAIGLTILTPEWLQSNCTLPLEIGAAMLVGVWYVGAGVDFFCRLACQLQKKNRKKENGEHI